ncbi:unnamed protein product [Caenorhabditis sp. 36 PRJEB53466]|nr:unnamed protein product [Caenorhabditis sp. 36 PRJEB53466]
MLATRPYEPPPDYPMLEQRWPTNTVRNSSSPHVVVVTSSPTYRSHSIDAAVNRSTSAYFQHAHRPTYHRKPHQQHEYPICGVSPARQHSYDHFQNLSAAEIEEMLRTRQFPEIAGIYGSDEQPALRRFTRYNQSISSKVPPPPPAPPHPPPQQTVVMDKDAGRGSIFSKSSKKPLFFMGNWTFRERNKSARPSISEAMREERPHSMNLSDVRSRSKSGEVLGPRSTVFVSEFPRNVETRVPVKIERSSMVRRKPSNFGGAPESINNNSSASSPSSSTSSAVGDFKTTITVDDDQVAVMRPKKDSEATSSNNNNNRYSFQSCVQLRKSCPDLDSSVMSNMEQHRVSKKRTRRAKEKMTQAAWKRKSVKEWSLDDVLLWLQSAQMDEVASLLIGYDLRGDDLLQWNDHTLAQLGVSSEETRSTLLAELTKIIENGPETVVEDVRSNHRTLFDIVKQTSYDQVLAVETPLTTRDITVTHGRLGCLQITKVNGANLPLKEHDCLLEINERAGEQFKSALMLTKLISDSNGAAIRFVVLRRKSDTILAESQKESSSSGISSSPQTPTE